MDKSLSEVYQIRPRKGNGRTVLKNMDSNQAMDIYKQAFPGVELSLFQMDLIEMHVEDAGAWQTAVEFWAGNDYRAKSVFKIIEYYKQVLREQSKSQVGKYDPTIQAPEQDLACPVCHKDICFELHRAA